MLAGTADPIRLADGAPELAGFDTAAEVLEGALICRVLFEIDAAALQELLPPALHPTLPPVVTFLAVRAPVSPWGEFQLAQALIECRSGTRPRGFLLGGFIDNPRAGRELAGRWGYRLRSGRVELERGYHRVTCRVVRDTVVLEVGLDDPERLSESDLQYVASMHLAHTPKGLRLVQVDPGYELERAERGAPFLDHFDAPAFAAEKVEPVYPISASLGIGRVTLPRLRFICRPDVLAFAGTERIEG